MGCSSAFKEAGLCGSQALKHSDAAGCPGRAENGVGVDRLDLALGQEGKGGSHRESLWLDGGRLKASWQWWLGVQGGLLLEIRWLCR